MEKSEIKLEIAKLNRKADMAENLLNGLSEETKKERVADIAKIQANIKEHRELAKLYGELL
jgi:hypothetical protein